MRAGDAKASARVKQTRLAWNKGGGVLSAVPVLQNILAYNTSSQICLNIAKFHYPNCNQHGNLATLRVRVSGGCKAKVRRWRWGRTSRATESESSLPARSVSLQLQPSTDRLDGLSVGRRSLGSDGGEKGRTRQIPIEGSDDTRWRHTGLAHT